MWFASFLRISHFVICFDLKLYEYPDFSGRIKINNTPDQNLSNHMKSQNDSLGNYVTKTLLFILILLLVQTFMNNKSFCTTTILGSWGDSKTNTRTIFVCLIQTNGFALFVAKFITARIEAKCIQGFVLCKCAYL